MMPEDTAPHLLVVDDDARIRALLQKYLVRNGFWVTTARDAAHARRVLAGLAFDLIVLDVMMPGEDGMTLTRAIRHSGQVPILLLTARGSPEDRIDGLEAGADEAKAASITEQVKADEQKVIDAGGLYVIGTERHESRRIDNQLRGRSGRQGDPGASKFFISLEDDLMRIFGSERIEGMLGKLGLQEGEAITHPWMNKALERAQSKVEARNYDIRKNLLKFDDVMNDQRKVIYEQRLELMDSEDVSDTIDAMRLDVNEVLINRAMPPKSYAEQWDIEALAHDIFRVYGLHLPVADWAAEDGIANDEMLQRLNNETRALFQAKQDEYGEEIMCIVQKRVLLETLDQLWKDHLLSLDHLRAGIGLRAYGQRDPLNEYKQEAFNLFETLLEQLREVTVLRLAHLQLSIEMPPEAIEEREQHQPMQESRHDPALADEGSGGGMSMRVAPEERDPANPESWGRVGRNEACPCGSGKKFKHCHGMITG
jgi:preprotein translocase subunit SecA